MNKSSLTAEESQRVFDHVIKQRRSHERRAQLARLGTLLLSTHNRESQEKRRKFYEERQKLIDKAPSSRGRMMTDEEALNVLSWWGKLLSYIKVLFARFYAQKRSGEKENKAV